MSAAAARSLSTFLFGVTAFDATSFVVVPLYLAVVAIAACLVPARRAARVDPLQALRANWSEAIGYRRRSASPEP